VFVTQLRKRLRIDRTFKVKVQLGLRQVLNKGRDRARVVHTSISPQRH
jgi:hypothetical protein